MSIREALQLEKDYFVNHPVYGSISDRIGTPYLSEQLNKILCGHIMKCLPLLNR